MPQKTKRQRTVKEQSPEYKSVSESESDFDSEDIDNNDKKTIKRKKKQTSSSIPKTKPNQTIVDSIAEAPDVDIPPGTIGKTTLDFLGKMLDDKCNNRNWLQLHDPVYRHALENWKQFIDHLIPRAVEKADDTLPYLPVKDVVYRFARDIRFSNDKTPYKKNFCASLTRTGRKGPYAGYHVQIAPNGGSFIAAGKWHPEKDELAVIRHHLMNAPRNLKDVIGAPEFVKHFGPPRPGNNIFRSGEALKVAPKGVDKNHSEIEYLKLRSFVVSYRFSDKQVLSKNFENEVLRIMRVMSPFVHCLNEMLVPTNADELRQRERANPRRNIRQQEESEQEEEDDDDSDDEEGGIEFVS